jgi:predicted ABC-type ATPase
VKQGGHNIPESVIWRRFDAGLRNFQEAYKSAVDAWVLFDNVGEAPLLLDWEENQRP